MNLPARIWWFISRTLVLRARVFFFFFFFFLHVAISKHWTCSDFIKFQKIRTSWEARLMIAVTKYWYTAVSTRPVAGLSNRTRQLTDRSRCMWSIKSIYIFYSGSSDPAFVWPDLYIYISHINFISNLYCHHAMTGESTECGGCNFPKFCLCTFVPTWLHLKFEEPSKQVHQIA